jgi:hypothetical protein
MSISNPGRLAADRAARRAPADRLLASAEPAPSLVRRFVAAFVMAAAAASFLWAVDARAEGGAWEAGKLTLGAGDAAAAPAASPMPDLGRDPAPVPAKPVRVSALPDRDVTGSIDATGGLPPEADDPAGGRIVPRASAPMACVPGSLKAVLARVADRFGEVSVESTRRGHTHNRRAGGARKSLHLSCRAVDFRVRGRTKGLHAFLKAQPEVGGFKVYRGGIIHIDDGERRRW